MGRSGPLPGPPPEHGTRARYLSRTYRCRCDECRAANTAYITLYRRNRRNKRNTEWLAAHADKMARRRRA